MAAHDEQYDVLNSVISGVLAVLESSSRVEKSSAWRTLGFQEQRACQLHVCLEGMYGWNGFKRKMYPYFVYMRFWAPRVAELCKEECRGCLTRRMLYDAMLDVGRQGDAWLRILPGEVIDVFIIKVMTCLVTFDMQ